MITLVRRRPHPLLTGFVVGMVGFRESTDNVINRIQSAGSLLPLVLSFGAPLDVTELADGTGHGSHTSFVAGLMTGPAATRFTGTQQSVQVYLTPLGAYRLLGESGRELARTVVAVDDLAPLLGGSLPDRLRNAESWHERFALVENVLLARLADSPSPDSAVSWMWNQIVASGGQHRISSLVAQTGWSHRHVINRFESQVGLPPKTFAQVVRFERALRDLGRLPLAEVAVRHGYSDQSHLTRETQRFSGEPPHLLALAKRPTAHTAMGA